MGVSANGSAIFVASSFCIPDSPTAGLAGAGSSSGISCAGPCSGAICTSGAGAGVEGSFSLTLRFLTRICGGSAGIDSPLFLALLRRFSGLASLSLAPGLVGSIVFFRDFLGGAGLDSSSTISGIGSGAFGVAPDFGFLERVRVNHNPSDSSS